VIQAQLEAPVEQQPEPRVGEETDRVARLETVVLVLGNPVKKAESLSDVNQ